MLEWEYKNFKYPPSVRRMHQLRSINPTIIEGFLNVVLSKDILTKELANQFEISIEEIQEIIVQEREGKNRSKKQYHFNEEWLNPKMITTCLKREKLGITYEQELKEVQGLQQKQETQKVKVIK